MDITHRQKIRPEGSRSWMDTGGHVADPSWTVRKRKRVTDTSEVARRVRHFRTAAGLTQEGLARRSHLTAKFVSQIENGRVNPSIEVIARLVEDGLELPMSAFFSVDVSGEVQDDLGRIVALLGAQPSMVRRRALRVVKALCDEE